MILDWGGSIHNDMIELEVKPDDSVLFGIIVKV